jgi:hypothetical protein
MSWKDIPGWFEEDGAAVYADAVRDAVPGDTLVEVGVAYGRSLACLGEAVIASGKRLRLIGVDPWEDTPEAFGGPEFQTMRDEFGGFYDACVGNLTLHTPEVARNVRLLKMSSKSATMVVPGPISFVFIDGDHSYEVVKADIAAWILRLAPGGVLAGHDYGDAHPGVKRAVIEAFGEDGAEIVGSCWRVGVIK